MYILNQLIAYNFYTIILYFLLKRTSVNDAIEE